MEHSDGFHARSVWRSGYADGVRLGAGRSRHTGGVRLGIALACAAVLATSACGGPGDGGGDSYVPTVRTYAPPVRTNVPDDPQQAFPRSAVPAEFQGTWSGGTSGGTAYGSVTLGPEGDLIIAKGRLRWAGTVVVERTQMTFYIPNTAPRRESWSWQGCQDPAGFGYPYRTLVLSGYSYVQDC
ncbi:hypothetical protein [Nonomuraea sp. NPDC049750]|uniref:hypothetical protein n=1 Tax=Nonomuraea sp. NPDC049750 TaxID=3154738 RepID=UPI0033C85D97